MQLGGNLGSGFDMEARHQVVLGVEPGVMQLGGNLGSGFDMEARHQVVLGAR